MRKNKTLLITVPIMIILLSLSFYNYIYTKIQSDISSIKEEQVLKTKVLQKYITLISEKPELEKMISEIKAERNTKKTNLIEDQTLSLAAAKLQNMVKDIITASGGTISSERVAKPEDLGKFRKITVSIDTILPDSKSLMDILYSIETRTPALIISELDTRIRNFRNPRELMVKIDVSALTSSR